MTRILFLLSPTVLALGLTLNRTGARRTGALAPLASARLGRMTP